MMNNKQNFYISSPNVTSAWLEAILFLEAQHKNEAFNLAVRIDDPTSELPHQRRIIEDYLEKHVEKWQQDHIQMVAQTIFPKGLLHMYCREPRDPNQRQQLYNQYMKNKEIIRAENPKGTYFQRLIWWPWWDTPGENRINQIENIIRKINEGKASRVVHELAMENPSNKDIEGAILYNPNRDRKCIRYMSFPCLSYISIKPESVEKKKGKIHMTAIYRNHYFISRAYGNYIGLGWLLNFISDATGRKPGELLCISSLAQLESPPAGLPKGKIKEMLKILRKLEGK